MNHQVITSRDNSLLQRARAVRDGKIRELIFVEGLRLCEEALNSRLAIEAVIHSEQIAAKERAVEFLAAVAPVAQRLVSTSERLLATISYTRTPQGIVLLASRPGSGLEFLVDESKPALVVVMHNLNNPVNVGAILRAAEAAGATGAITTAQTSDPFSPKALRGAMGSAFRLPVWSGPSFTEVVTWCIEKGLSTVCADARGDTIYTQVDWTRPTAFILGPETGGFSTEELCAAGLTVSIPMLGRVESLNVAVAAGVLLFEAKKQRH